MSGMIGSRQGWVEAPYAGCPAGPDDLAVALVPVPFEGATVLIVPGVHGADPAGVPEVMRGEETQIVGVLDQIGPEATACLPGSHSKWVSVRGGRIAGFQTHMTGEAFAALRDHTILGRTITEGRTVRDAFRRGVERARQEGGLLHHLFGVRTQTLFSHLPETEAGSYLSGLLIGHEVAASAPSGTVHLIGAPALCELYVMALEAFGVQGEIAAPEAAAAGLLRIAERAPWN
jgi:2-dehydro-3-deoxygalactonokinase